MNQIEINIIVGSLLDARDLTLYRISVDMFYREHGCDAQIEYK